MLGMIVIRWMNDTLMGMSTALADLDLNLLVALEALLDERHVTRAAARLGTSQPAASRALARLREHFGDPLLVRGGGELQLTERARTLLPRLVDVLRAARELALPEAFDPREARGTIRLAAPDIVSWMLVPPLLAALDREAPRVDLEIVQWQADWRTHLERGEIDLTVGFPKGDEPQIYAKPILAQDWAVVLRRGHPALRRPWTPATFAALDHALVTLTGRGAGPVDEALATIDRTRRVRLRVPYPLLAPLLAARSELVVTTVRWLARRLADAHGLVVRRPPIALPLARVPMVWHERSLHDPRQRWFRELLAKVASEIEPSQLRWE